MKKLLLFLISSLLPLVLAAQQPACNCLQNLDKTIEKTESNYAGFPDKTTGNSGKTYNALKLDLRKKAATVNETKPCYYLLRDYIRFFQDKHFSITYKTKVDFSKEILTFDEASFMNVKRPSGPEGIWASPDSSLILGIKKFQNNIYKAVVLSSLDNKLPKGLVYFTLQPNNKGYLLQQYNVFTSTDMYAQQKGELLQLWNFAAYKRISGKGLSPDEADEFSTWKNNKNGLDFKRIDQETSYIKIPTFFNNDSQIQKLVASNDSEIRSSKYLIIDLRGNGGGNSGWSNLLPYVMTGPIRQDSPLLRVSQDNIAIKRAELEPIVNNPISQEMKKYFPDQYVADLKKVYEELSTTKQTFYVVPGLTIPVDTSLKNPSKVALITDELCGSSTEYFFYLMAQSKKTVRYGSNTVGMMDYEGPASVTPLPQPEFLLMIPVSKSGWTDNHPIDQVGFKPDVPLNLPKSEWLNFITKDVKSRK